MSKHNSKKHDCDCPEKSKKPKCAPPVPGSTDLILKAFSKGEPIVVTVNGGAIQGIIVEILFNIRTLVVCDASGTYFAPFDNIDYVQAVASANIHEKIKTLKPLKVCDPLALATADAAAHFEAGRPAP